MANHRADRDSTGGLRFPGSYRVLRIHVAVATGVSDLAGPLAHFADVVRLHFPARFNRSVADHSPSWVVGILAVSNVCSVSLRSPNRTVSSERMSVEAILPRLTFVPTRLTK